MTHIAATHCVIEEDYELTKIGPMVLVCTKKKIKLLMAEISSGIQRDMQLNDETLKTI